MEHKDIYEHLAEIYLNASSRKNKKQKKHPKTFQKFLWLLIPVFLFIFTAYFTTLNKTRLRNSQISLVLQTEAVKINFHFDPAKKEIYTMNLNGLDLSRFKALEFALKKTNYFDRINLRVEFNSKFKEKSAIYLKDIPHRWQNFRVAFSEFKGISDWSQILSLSFIVEEWNAREKRGAVYVDNISLIR